MKFESKFNIGDKVYMAIPECRRIPVGRQCPVCKSTGRVSFPEDDKEDEQYTCPKCNGQSYYGYVDGKRRIYVTGPYTVTVVHCDTRYNEANPCAYAVEDERGDPQHNIREDIFYSTKEEADAYAYEWNRRADEADGLLDES